MAANSSIDRQGFLAGRLNVGGVWYYRDHDISKIDGLTDEDIDVYKRRGLINAHRMEGNRPVRGSNLGGLAASKPVTPLTTDDVPGTKPPVDPVTQPATEPQPGVTPAAGEADATEQVSEAARAMAERAERAARAIGAGKGGKRG